MAAYIVGHITVRNPALWDEYRAKVPDTLAPWGAELLFRGQGARVLAGEHGHTDIVAIRFPDRGASEAWHASAAYQALLPLRRQAADVVLIAYED
jgi:uncharacterized protein (DUF1330 family)